MSGTLLLFCLPVPLFAQQAFSESMADCAALYQTASRFMSDDDRHARLKDAARIWADAALQQADREGRAITTDEMWRLIDAKAADWSARGGGFFFTEEFRDWTRYCRSFGKARGIDTGL